MMVLKGDLSQPGLIVSDIRIQIDRDNYLIWNGIDPDDITMMFYLHLNKNSCYTTS